MGFWGIRSYENDLAADALDAGFERVHGQLYDDLMDDRNPVPFEKVQERLAGAHTLTAALAALEELSTNTDVDDDDDEDDPDLAYAGVVVRHVECRVEVPEAVIRRAIEALENEAIEWPRPTERKLRVDKEIALLRKRLPGTS